MAFHLPFPPKWPGSLYRSLLPVPETSAASKVTETDVQAPSETQTFGHARHSPSNVARFEPWRRPQVMFQRALEAKGLVMSHGFSFRTASKAAARLASISGAAVGITRFGFGGASFGTESSTSERPASATPAAAKAASVCHRRCAFTLPLPKDLLMQTEKRG